MSLSKLFCWGGAKEVKVPDVEGELIAICKQFFAAKGILFDGESSNTHLAAHSIVFEQPENPAHGDLATNTPLKYAKELKQPPLVIAEALAAAIHSATIGANAGAGSKSKIAGMGMIAGVKAVAPGYVNITLTPAFFALRVADIIQRAGDFGSSGSHADTTWVIDHTSPNPNKAMHLGHLRNNLVGMSVVRLVENAGGKVICDAVDNNRGIAIAKMMYGFLASMYRGGMQGEQQDIALPKNIATPNTVVPSGHIMTSEAVQYWRTHMNDWHSPKSRDMLPDVFASECYVKGELDFKASPEVEAIVRDMVVKWEARDKAIWELWEHVLAFGYEGMRRTLARLGNRWDHISHEHEHYQTGKDWVMGGLAEGIFKKTEDGAIVTDFSGPKAALTKTGLPKAGPTSAGTIADLAIPDTILLKNDGTSLYITQDLALAGIRRERYKADKMVYVVGPEQSLAMKQMFAACAELGIIGYSDMTHVTYGYMGLKDAETGNFKKMSSRAGNVLLIDDIIDAVKERVGGSEELALAAVKFSILKSDRNQDIAFDIGQSIETKGDSGVYVLYTYARAKSILAKAFGAPGCDMCELAKVAADLGAVGGKGKGAAGAGRAKGLPAAAQVVARQLSVYPAIVARSLEDLSVHHVAQYLLAVCSAFNSWYAAEIILDGGADQAAKLAVVAATAQVLENGLRLIGAPVVERV